MVSSIGGFGKTAASPLLSPSALQKFFARFRDGLSAKTSSQSGGTDDAVRVTLSKSKSNAGSDKANAAEASGLATGSQGVVGGFLSQISSVTERLKGLQKELSSETLNQDQKKALTDEVTKLNDEYSRIVSSDAFKQTVDYASRVTEILQGGADGRTVAATLGSARALLGDSFVSLVQSGNVAQLGQVSSSFQTLAGTDITSASTNPGVLDTIASAVHSAAGALQAPVTDVEKAKASVSAVPVTTSDLPQAKQLTFVGAEDIALSLKTYSSDDLVKAALAHIDINPVSVLMLVANPAKEDKAQSSQLDKLNEL